MAGKYLFVDYEKENYYEVPYWESELQEVIDLLEELREIYNCEEGVPVNHKQTAIRDLDWQILKLEIILRGFHSEGDIDE